MKNQMKYGKRLMSFLLVCMLVCGGCGSQDGAETTKESTHAGQSDHVAGETVGEDSGSNENGDASGSVDMSDMFSTRDYKTEYDVDKSAHIQLNGTSAACASDAVQISGTTVTITDEGTYILSGTLDDGRIVVNADDQDKVQLVLDGVSINSETSAAIYVLEGDKVFVTLAEGTTNTLSNGGSFVTMDDNNIDGAVFSKQDLTLNGSGSLTVNSPAGHGIVCKDDLVFTGGTYIINSASHGLDANDSVRIDGAELTISAGKDGIHVENEDDTTKGFVYIADGALDIVGEGDGISAGAYLQIDGGQFTILTGGGSANGEKQTSDAWGGFMGGGRGDGGMGGRGGRGDGGMGGPGGDPGNVGGDPGAQGGDPGSAGGDPSNAGRDPGAQGGFGEMGSSGDSSSDDSSTSIKGLKATGDLIINGGTFVIDSADDALHSNASVTVNGGSFEIATGDDGFHADETLTVTDGTIHITASYEGYEGLHILVSGGDSKIVSSDDGLNAAGGTDSSGFGGNRGGDMFGHSGGFGEASDGSITITGGSIYAKASGDGIDANGTLEISGGQVIVCGPTSGDTATLDYDISAVISGGTFIGTGGSMMAQTFSDSEQGVFAVSVGNQSAGTRITLTDGDGSELFSYAPELDYAIVILSSPDLVKGESYTIMVGQQSGTFEAQ